MCLSLLVATTVPHHHHPNRTNQRTKPSVYIAINEQPAAAPASIHSSIFTRRSAKVLLFRTYVHFKRPLTAERDGGTNCRRTRGVSGMATWREGAQNWIFVSTLAPLSVCSLVWTFILTILFVDEIIFWRRYLTKSLKFDHVKLTVYEWSLANCQITFDIYRYPFQCLPSSDITFLSCHWP